MLVMSARRALLVIDVQNEYFTGKMPVSYPAGSLEHILDAMDAAHASGVPVVVIQHSAPQPESTVFRKGSDGWQLHPDIARRSHDLLIEKNLPGSFTGTELEQWLHAHRIDSVTICGYMTQMCCDTTSRQAVHLGFDVEFLADATGTLDVSNSAGSISARDLHNAILAVQQSRFARVMTTGEWLSSLAQSAAK